MKSKNKKEDFLVCYQAHQMQVYQKIFEQVEKKTSKGRGAYTAGKGRGINKAGEGIVRVGYGSRSSKIIF